MTFFSGKKHKVSQASGFTLIELLISISVFLVIMTITMGSVVSIVNAGRKSRSVSSVMTNLNFTLEVMSRELKFGSSYNCSYSATFPPPAPAWSPHPTQNCTGNSGNTISFVTTDGIQTVYTINGTQIMKSIQGGAQGTYVGVTAPDVIVQALKFYVFNSSPQSVAPSDNAQPRVILQVRGYAGSTNQASSQSSFSLQTTLSQRALDAAGVFLGDNPGQPPTSQTPYRYVRWVINQRQCADNSIQVSELTLLQNNSVVPWPGGTTATNPLGTSPASGAEDPIKAVDNNTLTLGNKWLDFQFASNGYSQLDIDTGAGNTVLFNGYRWTTANDSPCRDPISWTLWGSNDSSAWTILDTQNNQAITSSRQTNTQTWTLP